MSLRVLGMFMFSMSPSPLSLCARARCALRLRTTGSRPQRKHMIQPSNTTSEAATTIAPRAAGDKGWACSPLTCRHLWTGPVKDFLGKRQRVFLSPQQMPPIERVRSFDPPQTPCWGLWTWHLLQSTLWRLFPQRQLLRNTFRMASKSLDAWLRFPNRHSIHSLGIYER